MDAADRATLRNTSSPDLIDPDVAHAAYERLSQLHQNGEAALLSRLEIAGSVAYWRSEVDGGPGTWETADVIRTLTWKALSEDAPAPGLAHWMLRARNPDGGFAPWPDVSSRTSYTESTARCLLSLLRLQQAAPTLAPDLRGAAVAAAKWLLECQRPDGGWGSSSGWTPRVSPTVWALLALGELERLGAREDATAREDAVTSGTAWLRGTQNEDGGFGLRRTTRSNVCSTAQAAWALGFRNEVINRNHHGRLVAFLSDELPGEVSDPIPDDPASKLFGRFELLLLSRPLGVLGLMAFRVDLRDSLLHKLLRDIEQAVGDDGLWRIPDGRAVWPSHFYLWAVRTWLAVYESYARAGLTADPGLVAAERLGLGAANRRGGRVFLSHSSANKVFVRQLARALDAAGWSPWFDERALVAGDDLVGGIGEGIKGSSAVVLVITDDFGGDDRWIGHEVSLAVQQQIEGDLPLDIIPIVLRGAEDRVPEKVRHLVWKTADGEADAVALILEALARPAQ